MRAPHPESPFLRDLLPGLDNQCNISPRFSILETQKVILTGRMALLVMTPLSDFANDHHSGGLSFSNSNAKNFLTKNIFMYLMVGSAIPS
jgi:hypothetical protein